MATDPVEDGLVASLNRPGGNVTGVTTMGVELGSKQLELLHELAPAASVIALLINRTNPSIARIQSRDVPVAARKLGLDLHILNASVERDFDLVFARMKELRVNGLLIGADTFLNARSEQLAALVQYSSKSANVRWIVIWVGVNRTFSDVHFVSDGPTTDIGMLKCYVP